MDDEVKLEVYYVGAFLRNPSLEYFGGKVEIVYRDPDLLSYFEIKSICEELGVDEPCSVHYLGPGGNLEQDLRLIEDDQDVVPMCKLNEGGPRDTIILYVESCNAPLVVEVPDDGRVGVGVGARAVIGGDGAGTGARATIRGVGAGVGGNAGAAIRGDGLEEEFDWLNENLEGEDFVNDIFGESSPPHTVQYEPNTIPTTSPPQPNIDAPGPSNVPPPNIDLDEEWAEPTLDDDITSVDSSDDEQRPRNLEFNERTDMENVRLAKGMKFPNSQVFRKALREYVIQNHIDVKWKLNEKKKISVHCKNNCGWRCYASIVTGECTFEIKTLYPECTCPLTFKNGQVTSAYVAKKYLEDFGKNLNWEVSGVKYHVMQNISIDLSLSQVYRSRKAAKGLIIGNEETQYGLLRDYAEMILRTNVESRVILQT
nr:uncharacterized protein LOC111999403 [Quercus suber]